MLYLYIYILWCQSMSSLWNSMITMKTIKQVLMRSDTLRNPSPKMCDISCVIFHSKQYTLKIWKALWNKANLRDLIAVAGLVTLLKSDPNRFFSACMTLKFESWPQITIGNLFHASKSYVCHLIAIREFKLELSSRNAQIWAKSSIFSALVPLMNRWPSKT